MRTNKVIYTSLTKGYDILPQYDVISDDFDYICFSNDYPNEEKIGQWEIRSIPYEHNNTIRLSRYVKLLPHRVIKEYEWSLWLDANISVTDKLFYNYVQQAINSNVKWGGIKHQEFDCIYDDAKKALRIGKARYSEIKDQVLFLRNSCYPRHEGLYENNIILRQHNNNVVKKIDEEWWELFNRFSKRDQLSLFFIFWKNNFVPDLLLPEEESARNTSYLRCTNHPMTNYFEIMKLRLLELKNRIIINSSSLFDF